jgi:hypothetical protein
MFTGCRGMLRFESAGLITLSKTALGHNHIIRRRYGDFASSVMISGQRE